MKSASQPTSLANLTLRFSAHLTKIFDSARLAAARIDPLQLEVIDQISLQVLKGGKRLRPTLTYLSCIGAGGQDQDSLIMVCCAMELIHHFLLIHDDIIDRDLTRHGAPNVLGRYKTKFEETLPGDEAFHYGASFAIMAGNVSSVIARQTILKTDYRDAAKIAVLDILEDMLFDIMGGQLLDVAVAMPGAEPASSGTILRIARFKTASYSFEAPMQIGATLAQAPQATLKALKEFGSNLGVAFQLADDLLGLYGQEAEIGKSVLSDMQEGKQTLLIYYARQMATPAQVATLNGLWGGRDGNENDLNTAKSIVESCGAKAKVEQFARTYESRARIHLEAARLTKETQEALKAISASCVDRKF